MNLLLVDDQPSILSSLMTGIDWHGLGFTSVFTAGSAERARAILQAHRVDVMISDIEMPNEDGLSLLAWARKQGYGFECVLLTAHADFFYAQQAISLKVAEYVIQPARFEDIIKAVQNCVASIRSRDLRRSRLESSRIGYAARNLAVKALIERWPGREFARLYPEELTAALEQVRQLGIDCEADSPVLVLAAYPRRWSMIPLAPEEFLEKFELLCREALGERKVPTLSCYLGQNHFASVLFTPLDDGVRAALRSAYEQTPGRLGPTLRLAYAPCTPRTLKNTLDAVIQQEDAFNASADSDAVHLLELDIGEQEGSTAGENHNRYLIGRIREYIRDHMDQPISRGDIADHLHISPDHVSYIVKSVENKTVKELITSQKMEHARRLLRGTRISIGEVSQKCGYDSFAYFSKVYRETWGQTPSQERDGK